MVGLSITWIKLVHDIERAFDSYDWITSALHPFLPASGFDVFAGVFASSAVLTKILATLDTNDFAQATIVILKTFKFDGAGACDGQGDLKSLCMKLQADAAFLFIGFMSAAAALFFVRKRKQSDIPRVYAYQSLRGAGKQP